MNRGNDGKCVWRADLGFTPSRVHIYVSNEILLSRKKDETRPFATPWVGLRGSYAKGKGVRWKKTKYHRISLICEA